MRMEATTLRNAAGDWVDPDAISAMIDSVRTAYAAAPGWVQIGLVVILAVAVVVGAVRVASSVASRLIATAVLAVIAAVFWFYGSDLHWLLTG